MAELEGPKTGLKTAVAEAVAQTGEPDHVDGEQLALLPMPLRNAAEGQAAEKGVPSRRGRGRPPGAKNKSTEAWREFLLKQYRSPLQGLAEMYSRSVHDLAVELGFTVRGPGDVNTRTASPAELLELLKLQISAMKELAPYVHQKQPMAIEAGEGGLIPLNIIIGQPQQQGDQDAVPAFKILDAESEENQSLSDQEKAESAAHESATSEDNGENKGKVENQTGDGTSPRKDDEQCEN